MIEPTSVQAVTVRILDKDYKIACPAGERNALILSSKRVDQEMRKIRESGKVVGTDKIAVIVALNLAHELLTHLNATPNAADETALREQMLRLQHQLDQALNN